MSVYVYVYMSLRGGRSPKVSLGVTCVVVCLSLGFSEDCFWVYLGLVYWIFFRAYFGLVQLIVMLFVFFRALFKVHFGSI